MYTMYIVLLILLCALLLLLMFVVYNFLHFLLGLTLSSSSEIVSNCSGLHSEDSGQEHTSPQCNNHCHHLLAGSLQCTDIWVYDKPPRGVWEP